MAAITHLDNCRIEFAALDKLFIRQLGVFIFVHVLEDLVHSLKQPQPRQMSLYRLWQKEVGRDRTFSGVFSSSGSWTIWSVIL